jgi:succinylarginine dihydrolase
MTAREWNLDGLVGPTHSYAGLSPGNLASHRSAGRRSNPRAAALQGLEKMARLHALGVPQLTLPPQPRPDLDWLRRLGFSGDDAQIIERAHRESPPLLAAAYSASSMWAANAATVVPSSDSGDGRLHLVPANLTSERHRALEAPWTARVLKALFPDPERFVHHAPVPLAGDEGAANHMRLCHRYADPGLEVFVYGQPEGASGEPGGEAALPSPSRHPARQTEAASRAVARLAGLDASRALFLRQAPHAIDAGVFHNDVIATSDRDLLFLHEDALADQGRALDRIREAFERGCGGELRILEVPREVLPIDRAVSTYLFNCQIVETARGETVWIGPIECQEDDSTASLLEQWTGAAGPFDGVQFVDLRESMRNGGGPACLRLRVVLTESERAAMQPSVHFDEDLHARLSRVVEQHYRDRLDPEDLADPALVDESRRAFEAVLGVLGLEDLLGWGGEVSRGAQL